MPVNATHPGSGSTDAPWPPVNGEPPHRSEDTKVSVERTNWDEHAQEIAAQFANLPPVSFELRDTADTRPVLPGWADELQRWWIDTAAADIAGSIDKITAYGGRGAAYDLIATGHDLAALNGRRVGDEEATELAIVFYLSSKVNRMLAAAIDGRRGSDDTALDITFYSLMLRRTRASGGWPVA